MKTLVRPPAAQRRAKRPQVLLRFSLKQLERHLPLTFALDPAVPPSPKHRYLSSYRYQGRKSLRRRSFVAKASPFTLSLCLWDWSGLRPWLAQIYRPSAKGQVPYDPVSLYLLSLYRRSARLSRLGVIHHLHEPKEGRQLRRQLGFRGALPSESGLRHFENQLTPELQREINALQLDGLYRAGLLPTQPALPQPVSLSFDGMLHQARSRMRCSSVQDPCYQPAPRPCRARQRGKQGCDCLAGACAQRCRYTTPRDPKARFIVYSASKKQRRYNPNAAVEEGGKKSSPGRLVYGYYSYAGQLLDPELATYWLLPTAFAPATVDDRELFPRTFTYLQARFPWLIVREVMADAGAGYANCLDLIWQAGALRMVDLLPAASDTDRKTQLDRWYDEKGYPLCPRGYVLHPNGYDYRRRRAKWRCRKRCLREPNPDPEQSGSHCPFLAQEHKHGYTAVVGRTHRDGNIRLAREIPYGSPAWQARYNQRNAAESRNGILQLLGLKRLPVHGLDRGHVVVLQAELVANLNTLVRLVRQASQLLT
jgi:hypothetical protein